MKKTTLLLIAFISIIKTTTAQFTVWEDDFNDNDISDWTVHDTNGDGHSWQANQDFQVINGGQAAALNGDHAVMATYTIDVNTLESYTDYKPEWAISPAIDLSFYMGSTELTFNAQMAIFTGSKFNLDVYASTSLDTINFKKVAVVEIIGGINDEEAFRDYKVDLSEFVGEDEVYFAFVTIGDGPFGTGYEIDKVSISVEALLSTEQEALKNTKLVQNPVNNKLQLQFGTGIVAENTLVQLYDMSGKLLKKEPYKENGIAVDNLQSGMYIARITNRTASTTLKFIKN